MVVESRFQEIDLGDGVEAVETPSMDEAGQSSRSMLILILAGATQEVIANTSILIVITAESNPFDDPSRKPSQSSLQTSSSRTDSQSGISVGESFKRARPETAPPAYHDVEAQRSESEATESIASTQVIVTNQQQKEDRAAGRGFLSWFIRPRPPPSYPSERSVSPEYTAGIFSRLTFQWMSPLMSVSKASCSPPPAPRLFRRMSADITFTCLCRLLFVTLWDQAAEDVKQRWPLCDAKHISARSDSCQILIFSILCTDG